MTPAQTETNADATPVAPSRLLAALAHNPNVRKGHAGDDAVQLYLTNQGIGHTVLQHLRALGYEVVSINPRIGMVRCVPVHNPLVAPKHNGDAVKYHRGRLVTDGGEDVERTTACPECDSSDWAPVTGRNGDRRDVPDADYYCRDCQARFNELVERPVHQPTSTAPTNGHAKHLWQADSDDLVTDGGQTALSRNPSERELVEPEYDGDRHPTCPDCGQRVSASKGGHSLPNSAPADATIHHHQLYDFLNGGPQ